MRLDVSDWNMPVVSPLAKEAPHVVATESLHDITWVGWDELISSITPQSLIQPLYRGRFLMVVKTLDGEIDAYAVGEGSRYLEISLPEENREMILECHNTAKGRECHDIRHINGKAYAIYGIDVPFRVTDPITREMLEGYPNWNDVQACHHRMSDITAFVVKNGSEWKACKR